LAVKERLKVYATAADARTELDKAAHDSVDQDSVWIFGNEARGLPQSIMEDLSAQAVSIPISTHVESLNLATAAAVVMYAVSSAAK
jgi:TrmH family RNA methyltransferase